MFAAMPRLIWRCFAPLCLAVVAAIASVGCVRAYRPPTSNEPHSILKLRRTYDKTAGTHLSETLMLGEERGFGETTDAGMASTAKNDAILIHPIPVAITMHSAFTHSYTHQVLEHYNAQEPYWATETYNCGSGTSYRTCTRSATRYRSVSKTRWVTRTDTIVDGACEQSLQLSPKQGSSYLLQFTYQDKAICTLSCFEQVTLADGGLSQIPCGR